MANEKKNSFKQPKHPDWPCKNIAYDCWFIPIPGVEYDEDTPAGSRYIPQSVWDTGKAMQYLWNFLYREFKKLRDVEPLKCDNGHDLTYEQIYTDPKKRRAKFCGVCKAENGDKENYVWTKSALKGKDRFGHYKAIFDLLRSPVGCYRLFLAGVQDPEERRRIGLHPPAYESIVNRFRDVLQRWMSRPQQFDPPRFKPTLDSIRLPFKEKTGGKPVDLFINDGGKWAGVIDTRHLAPEPNHRCPDCGEWLNIQPDKALAKCKNGHEREKPPAPEKPQEYLANGYFMLGTLATGARLNLHVAYNRPLSEMEDGLVKEVALSGKHVKPRGWKWQIIFSVQAPFPAAPRERDCVVAVDLGWRRMPKVVRTEIDADGKKNEVIIAPERIRVAAIHDGHCWHEIFLPIDLTNARDAKAGKKISPKENRELETRIGDGIQACKEALAAMDRSAWPDAAKQIWQGHKKMRENGLRSLRKELAAAGITVRELEDWDEDYQRLFRKNRHIEIKLVGARTHLYRNLLDGIAKQSRAVILDDLQVKEKAERGRRRVIARKKKHAETGVWDARTEAERIEENAAKWRAYICLSDFRRFLKEACAKYGTEIIEFQQDNSCQVCGEPIDFKEGLHGQCANGHWQEKNKNAARNLWEMADAPGKADAPPLALESITEQGRKLIRELESSLALAASAD